MDRGDGGGPPRKGSSLPRTLHGSLLQPGSQAMGNVYDEEPQASSSESAVGYHEYPDYTPYQPQSLRDSPIPSSSRDAPDFEEGSSRGVGALQLRGGPGGSDRQYDEGQVEQYQPQYRTHVGSTEPSLYTSPALSAPHRSSTQIYSYHPSTASTRLPPVRVVEEDTHFSSAPPSSRRHGSHLEPYPPQPEHHDTPESSQQVHQRSIWDIQWEETHRNNQFRFTPTVPALTNPRDDPWTAIARRREEDLRESARILAATRMFSFSVIDTTLTNFVVQRVSVLPGPRSSVPQSQSRPHTTRTP